MCFHQNHIPCCHQLETQRSSLLVFQNTFFWNYSNLNSAWSISGSMLLKLLQLNLCRYGPITHAHSTTCCWTPLNMQLVPYSKIYFPKTSTPKIPWRTGPTPWCRMFHTFTIFALSPSSSQPPPADLKSISFYNYLNLT